MLYELSGAITANAAGWEFVASENPGGVAFNPAEGYYPDKGDSLKSPFIHGVEPFAFYRLSFEAETEQNGFWNVFFFTPAGVPIVSDVYSSVYASAIPRKYEVVLYGRHGGNAVRVGFQSACGIKVKNLSLEKITPAAAADWCDALYAELPSLHRADVGAAQALLPETLRVLADGQPWRVVMLGDSIVNDTFNSNFQALVRRKWEKSACDFICSVRGSTGCWYYQEEAHFTEYVSSLKPDLLIIGGISQKEQIDPISKVIDLARENLNCEILLLSGPIGIDDDSGKIAVQNKFAQRQGVLAQEKGVAFLDCCRQWNDYVANCGRPAEFFHRDPVHGNDRGKQIAGRMLAAVLGT